MKRACLAILVLAATGLLLGLAVPAVKRAAQTRDSERAAAALADCYRFVFADTMDRAVLGRPLAMPAKLEDVPGWNEYVNKAGPAAQVLYRSIDWHPARSTSAGDEIASIELPNARAVLFRGGSAYAVGKR